MGVKKHKLVVEEEINKLRLFGDLGQSKSLLLKRNEKDQFDMLVRAELIIEDYLYVNGSAPSEQASKVESLIEARKSLQSIINNPPKISSKSSHEPKPYQKTILMEAKIMMMKLVYLFGEMKSIDLYFNETELSASINNFISDANPRMIRLVAEAFAIKGLQQEHNIAASMQASASNRNVHMAASFHRKGHENPKKYFELSANACISFLKCSESVSLQSGHSHSSSNALLSPGISSTTSSGIPHSSSYAANLSSNASGGTAVNSNAASGPSNTHNPLGGLNSHTNTTSTAPTVTNFLEYAVHRLPSMLFMEGDVSGSVNKLREYLQLKEISLSPDLRALLARQLAEILLRFVSDSTYTPLMAPEKSLGFGRVTPDYLNNMTLQNASGGTTGYVTSRPLSATPSQSFTRPMMLPGGNLNSLTTAQQSNTLNSHMGKIKNRTSTLPNIGDKLSGGAVVGGGNGVDSRILVPQKRSEEILLLLLITEALISKELVLDMSTEHAFLRSKKLNEEKFVLDLLIIILINGQQYNLLTQAIERGMSVAFEDKEMWFKFGLSLISSGKYARAIVVLKECAKIDPNNYLYHSLISRVALQNIRDVSLAIESAEKALEVANYQSNEDQVTCYEIAKIYLLMAISYSMKAESGFINASDKQTAWQVARTNFAKAYELDDMEPCIAYNFALCLAKSRKIPEAFRLIRDFEDYGPVQELNILLLTSMKKYLDALELVTSYLSNNSENITLLYLKISIEEKLFGPSMASKNINKIAVALSSLGFPALNFNDSSSTVAGAGMSTDRQLSSNSANPTFTNSLGRSQAPDYFLASKLNASQDGLSESQYQYHGYHVNNTGTSSRGYSNYGTGGPLSFIENFTLSDGGIPSSVDSQRRGGVESQLNNTWGEDDVNTNIWILMFEFFVKMDKLEDAKSCVEEFSKFVRSEHAMYHVLYANGILAEKESSLEEAKTFYKQALIFNPRGVEARHRLAGCLKQDCSLEYAEKVLRECLQIDTYDEKSWELLGEILTEKGDTSGACECLKTASTLEKSSPIKTFSSLLNWTF